MENLLVHILAVVLSVGPSLGVVAYFARRGRLRPDRADVVLRAFIGGVAVTVPAYLAQHSLDYLIPWLNSIDVRIMIEAFVTTALIEEALKLFIVLRLAYPNPAFKEVHDGILYAIAAGLGFCCLENILYAGDSITVSINRACTALPLHALASGLMGYEVGMAKLRPRSRHRVWHGLWKAVLVHGTYDVILMLVVAKRLPEKAAFLIVPLLALSYIWLIIDLQRARRKDRAQAYVYAHT